MNKFDKTPRNKNRRDFLIFSIFFLIIIPTLITIQYHSSPEKESAELPEIYIKCSQKINSEIYIPAELRLNKLSTSLWIKYRGGGYSNVPKMGYRLELENEYSLLGMRIDDDWQLFACY